MKRRSFVLFENHATDTKRERTSTLYSSRQCHLFLFARRFTLTAR